MVSPPIAAVALSGRLQLAAIATTVILLAIVFELVRQRRLMERYSLLWLFAAFVLLLLAIFSGLLSDLSRLIGIATPSNALFGVAIGFATLMLLHFSVTISRITDQNKVLAQKLAATEERLRRVEGDYPVPGAPDDRSE
ncbi:MAG: DUF2304 domain-containing protein [Thermoleophilia bacterium]|nr:DUF2304 domain-containing protein [Thermoleophilia bacterium]